ncbi:MAG: CPBP family intramembrane metalloprotease [Anaerolineae bacterium]|nr:CPBP family intramembrane metalloprotease [Anaerolineae bacterium]
MSLLRGLTPTHVSRPLSGCRWLALLWLAATATTTLALARPELWTNLVGGLLGLAYIGGLLWYLVHTPPHASDLPDLPPDRLPGTRYPRRLTLILLTLALLFVLAIPLHPLLVLIGVFAVLSGWLIVHWRARLTRRLVALGLAAGGVILVAQAAMGQYDPYMVFYLAMIPLLFIAGGLLVGYSGLSKLTVLQSGRAAVKSFGWGCLLALPPALLNVLGGAQRGDSWVDHWWQPVAALVPGIAEETWARLFLVSLVYVLLRPRTNDQPERAARAAILISALTHGFAHLPTLALLGPGGLSMLVAALLYGVPMGMLFVKRDFEHAVGYHFCVDLLRFIAAGLGIGMPV